MTSADWVYVDASRPFVLNIAGLSEGTTSRLVLETFQPTTAYNAVIDATPESSGYTVDVSTHANPTHTFTALSDATHFSLWAGPLEGKMSFFPAATDYTARVPYLAFRIYGDTIHSHAVASTDVYLSAQYIA